MSAGTGVQIRVQPEQNGSSAAVPDPIIPQETGITPLFEQRRFDAAQGKQLALSPDVVMVR